MVAEINKDIGAEILSKLQELERVIAKLLEARDEKKS